MMNERIIPNATAIIKSNFTVTIIVTSITTTSPLGATCIFFMLPQSNIPIPVKIKIPDNTASGIYCTTEPRPIIKINKITLCIHAESAVLPPLLIFTIDLTVAPAPANPPNNPLIILPIPCPTSSLLLL
ncbi:Uncharacterised protein [Streptococcus pneumoniae]|nr:Uncharacterised protein [Streptococcus pneumoniae]